jgi:hypothetical protein
VEIEMVVEMIEMVELVKMEEMVGGWR